MCQKIAVILTPAGVAGRKFAEVFRHCAAAGLTQEQFRSLRTVSEINNEEEVSFVIVFSGDAILEKINAVQELNPDILGPNFMIVPRTLEEGAEVLATYFKK